MLLVWEVMLLVEEVGGGERVLPAAAAEEKAPLVCWGRLWVGRRDPLPTSWNDIVVNVQVLALFV